MIMEDREMLVAPGQVVRTAWLPIEQCMRGSTHPLAVGDVAEKRHRLLQMGEQQPWPPVVGHWQGDRFVIMDGNHTFVALQMLGRREVFVCWVEEAR